MTDFAIQRLQRRKDKLGQAPQPEVTLLDSPPASPWFSRPLPAQLQPDILQHKTQSQQQKPVRRILTRRPAAHLPRTAVAALDAKTPPIALLCLPRTDLDADQQVGQPDHLWLAFLRLFHPLAIKRHLHAP